MGLGYLFPNVRGTVCDGRRGFQNRNTRRIQASNFPERLPQIFLCPSGFDQRKRVRHILFLELTALLTLKCLARSVVGFTILEVALAMGIWILVKSITVWRCQKSPRQAISHYWCPPCCSNPRLGLPFWQFWAGEGGEFWPLRGMAGYKSRLDL